MRTNDAIFKEALEERNCALDKEEARFEDARIRSTKVARVAIFEELGFGEVCGRIVSITNIP